MATEGKLIPIPLSDEDKERLSVALGGPGAFSMFEESEFIAQSGCPPEELERWLESCWLQHDIRAVLGGLEKVGPQPLLLVGFEDQYATVRLFCPTEKLLWENAIEDGLTRIRELIATRPWPQSAEEITSQIAALTAACTARELPTSEIKLLWFALTVAIQVLVELRGRPYTDQMKQLHAAMVAFAQACHERGSDLSPQAKYSEARVSSRRALSENHNPVLDGFPELVAIAREICSQELAAYMAEDVRLSHDQFLDMLHVIAHDRADPATVANPSARIRAALSREHRRSQMLYRKRWMPLSPAQTTGLEDPHAVESAAIAKIDWERGKRDLELPPDQRRAVEARFDGLNLQASGVPDELACDPTHLESVRRSLEPDRRWGQRLRKRFAAYAPKRNPARQS